MRRLVLTAAARRDAAAVLRESRASFGPTARARYALLLKTAYRDLQTNPLRPLARRPRVDAGRLDLCDSSQPELYRRRAGREPAPPDRLHPRRRNGAHPARASRPHGCRAAPRGRLTAMPKIKNLGPSVRDRQTFSRLSKAISQNIIRIISTTPPLRGLSELAVRESWSDEFVQKIIAAGISNRLGIGLEYALKEHVVPAGSLNFRREERLDEKIEQGVNYCRATILEIYAFPKADGSPEGEFFSGTSLLKALATLHSAHGLAQQGYLLEPLVLIRSALEVIAWSRACHDIQDGGDYLAITTTQAISMVKSTLPSLPKLYGILSKFAHWHPDLHLAFMTLGERAGVITRSLDYKTSTLIAVASGYLLACSVFLDLMHR